MYTDREKEKKRLPRSLRFDAILIVGLLLISLISLLCIFFFREQGSFVEVELDGEVMAKYSLAQNGEYSLNGGSNILVIENGEAYLSYADCPDKTCVRTGRIRYAGQSIICLPNRLSVTVRSNHGQDGVDIVS